jgi:hypothetical protein
MRINELLTEEQVNEISLGKKIAAGAARFAQGAGDVIGGTLGGIQGAWSRGTRAYQRGKEVVDPIANPKAEPATATTPASTDRPYVAPSTGGAEDPEKLRAQAAELNQKADAIEKQKKAAPAPTSDGTNPAPVSKGPQGGDQSNKGFGFNPHTAQPFASAAERAAFDASPEAKMSTADWEAAQAAKAPPTAPPEAPAPAPNYGNGQTQVPAPSKVNYSGIPKAAPLPQATTGQGAYSVKSAYGQPAPGAPAPAAAPAPQFKGPKVNGLQVRNMGEGKKLKFRSNFLDMDL